MFWSGVSGSAGPPSDPHTDSSKASLSVPALSKLGKRRYMYRTCTQTWLNQPLCFNSYNCILSTWCFLSQQGSGRNQINLPDPHPPLGIQQPASKLEGTIK